MGFVNFLCLTALWTDKHVTDKVISRYSLLVPALALEPRLSQPSHPHLPVAWERTENACSNASSEKVLPLLNRISVTRLTFCSCNLGSNSSMSDFTTSNSCTNFHPFGSIVPIPEICCGVQETTVRFPLEVRCNQAVCPFSAYARCSWSNIQATVHKPASSRTTNNAIMPHCGWTGTSFKLKSGA